MYNGIQQVQYDVYNADMAGELHFLFVPHRTRSHMCPLLWEPWHCKFLVQIFCQGSCNSDSGNFSLTMLRITGFSQCCN